MNPKPEDQQNKTIVADFNAFKPNEEGFSAQSQVIGNEGASLSEPYENCLQPQSRNSQQIVQR